MTVRFSLLAMPNKSDECLTRKERSGKVGCKPYRRDGSETSPPISGTEVPLPQTAAGAHKRGSHQPPLPPPATEDQQADLPVSETDRHLRLLRDEEDDEGIPWCLRGYPFKCTVIEPLLEDLFSKDQRPRVVRLVADVEALNEICRNCQKRLKYEEHHMDFTV